MRTRKHPQARRRLLRGRRRQRRGPSPSRSRSNRQYKFFRACERQFCSSPGFRRRRRSGSTTQTGASGTLRAPRAGDEREALLRHDRRYGVGRYGAAAAQDRVEVAPDALVAGADQRPAMRTGHQAEPHERIYQMIWQYKRDGGDLWRGLRRRGKRYNKRGGKDAGRGLIPVDHCRPQSPSGRLGGRYRCQCRTQGRLAHAG